jgi:hypothetical protein
MRDHKRLGVRPGASGPESGVEREGGASVAWAEAVGGSHGWRRSTRRAEAAVEGELEGASITNVMESLWDAEPRKRMLAKALAEANGSGCGRAGQGVLGDLRVGWTRRGIVFRDGGRDLAAMKG